MSVSIPFPYLNTGTAEASKTGENFQAVTDYVNTLAPIASPIFTGNVTQPDQPSFLVFNSTSDANVTGDDTDVTVEFDSVVYDQGSNFNNTTDTFTAPVTGRYFLSATVRTDDIPADVEYGVIHINTSNRNYYCLQPVNPSKSGTQAFSISVIADMDANDTATVLISLGTGTKQVDVYGNASNPQTFFSGSLIN